MNNLAFLGLTLWLSLTPLANSDSNSVLVNTQKKIFETISTPGEKTKITEKPDIIDLLDTQRKIEIRKEIQEILKNEFKNNNEIQKLKKEYGEPFILDQLTLLIAFIEKDLEKFWTIKENWEYQPDELKIKTMVRNIFWNEMHEQLKNQIDNQLKFALSASLSSLITYLIIIITSYAIKLMKVKKKRKGK